MKPYHKNVRLPHYDYSSAGAYFVTIVVAGRECSLGRISDGRVELTENGESVIRGWKWLPEQYPFVALDEFVVMPNHIHGILHFYSGKSRGLPLGRIVAAFKTITTRDINRLRNSLGQQFWQDNFYEHVIRGERDLAKVREYILNNPLQWTIDEENPERHAV